MKSTLRVMSSIILLFFATFVMSLRAEYLPIEDAPAEQPKPPSPPQKTSIDGNPKRLDVAPPDKSKRKKSKRELASLNPNKRLYFLGVLAQTPTIKENTFDKRFQAYGLTAFFSGEITAFNAKTSLYAELGVDFTFSRVSLFGSNFNHIYYGIPLRLRLERVLQKKLSGEIIAGIRSRLLEYDGREGANGGLFFVDNIFDHLDPDFGVGITYYISRSTRFRVTAGYLQFAIGIETSL